MGISNTGDLGTNNDLSAATNTTLYDESSGTHFAVGVLTVMNRNSLPTVKIRAAVTAHANANPGNADWKLYDVPLAPNMPITMALTVGASQKLVVYSDTAGVSASFNGLESTTT